MAPTFDGYCEGLGTILCPYRLFCELLAGARAALHCRGLLVECIVVLCFFVHGWVSIYTM